MGVVTDVGRNKTDMREPTWEEAAAVQAAATPVEVVRPKRQVIVTYRFEDGVFTATSPQLRSLRITGPTLEQTMSLVRQALDRFLDPAVEVREVLPRTDSHVCTAAAGHSWLKTEALSTLLAVPSTSSAVRAFVSSSRRSRRVRA
jgi:predicted RNase H-like HicB family nuclease